MTRSRAAVTTVAALLGVLALVAGCAGYSVQQPSSGMATAAETTSTTRPWWAWWWNWPWWPPTTTTTAPGTSSTTTPPTTVPGEEPGAGQPIGFGRGTTGGAGGPTVTVTSSSALADAAEGDERRVIRVQGTVQLSGMVRIGSNKTLTGTGGGRLVGGGLNIREANNVIVQNLTISGSGDDNINIETSTNVWIDHNDLSGAEDGALDIKRASDNVTVSWNHFHDQDKTALLGHDDGNGSQDRGRRRVTYHHNWFDGTGQRHPRVRFGNPVHVFNNYYSDIGDYGVASTMEAGVLVEGNYFENTEDPFHRGEGSSPDGALVARNNHFVNSGSGETGGSVAGIPYSYPMDAASSVKSVVTSGAGTGKI
jgi:pectate lyase